MAVRSGGDRLRQTRLIPRSPDGDKNSSSTLGKPRCTNITVNFEKVYFLTVFKREEGSEEGVKPIFKNVLLRKGLLT